ncbi:MAG TPA: RNA polymerase factor sigma-32 [Alphaproteobacteria bacterium]|jgi:RNA polymerase sigma-32 factor|nr:RNA polymerase factor sigma-32 [Alphaproteobacteria bacterium]
MSQISTAATERSNRRYISATMEAPLLERDHEADVARRWLTERDTAALHELIESHARLVVRIAAGFRSSGLPLADLVQEGNIGLMEAADRFDPERNVRFSTYASWWIVAAIQNYILRNASIVRAATTPKQRRLFFNLRRLRARNGAGFDGRLTDADRVRLAEQLGVTVAEVEKMEAHLARPDQSLNATVGQEDSLEQQDLLADSSPTPEDIVIDTNRVQARSSYIKQALAKLSPRERDIIASRYLDDRRTTLAEIGEEYGVSKERIRQIEGRALQKMQAALRQIVDRPEELLES